MKNVVITGSTRGIGLAMAKEFLRAGCNVTISGRAQEISPEIEKVLSPDYHHDKEFSVQGMGKYAYIPCDVRKIRQMESLWTQSVQQWGRIDIWINNAGRNCPYELSYQIDASEVDDLFATNINAVVHGSSIAAKNMLMQGEGQIWNMEGLGSNNRIEVKTILYGTTKSALSYFTRGLAKELKGTGVMAGRLSPGMMLTDFITKTPDGADADVIKDKKFRFVFNALADRPETVAAFFVPRILRNADNDAQIVWLTNTKAFWRFLSAPFSKRRLL